MAGGRSRQEDWKAEDILRANEAQDADEYWQAGPAAYGQHERILQDDSEAMGESVASWSDQPTQPQRSIKARRAWPPQSSAPHPEWPMRDVAARTAASPLHRLLAAAHERQFNLGCGTVAALVLIVAALLAAFTNGWLPTNAGPIEPPPGIQTKPDQSTIAIPTITPRPSPTATPVPTDTPIPTETPVPTVTPMPTESPIPTQTPVPSPTATPLPTETTNPLQEPTVTPALP